MLLSLRGAGQLSSLYIHPLQCSPSLLFRPLGLCISACSLTNKQSPRIRTRVTGLPSGTQHCSGPNKMYMRPLWIRMVRVQISAIPLISGMTLDKSLNMLVPHFQNGKNCSYIIRCCKDLIKISQKLRTESGSQ